MLRRARTSSDGGSLLNDTYSGEGEREFATPVETPSEQAGERFDVLDCAEVGDGASRIPLREVALSESAATKTSPLLSGSPTAKKGRAEAALEATVNCTKSELALIEIFAPGCGRSDPGN